ncbi:MAG: choline-sulfatase [Candidatus Protistobacter heckmanni]|nr:choline-sulfatase [Candidatus Protistobacter heckmanni]
MIDHRGGQRPNLLFLIADQLTALAPKIYGNGVCKTPNIDRLTARSTQFRNMYCNFPLCAPSCVALLTGQLSSKVRVYDNATEFAASTPTFLHFLKLAGYRTVLSGKMHFVGPEQQHGFDEWLTTDIYPTDFGWTPDWRQAIPIAPTGMKMRSVVEAGVCKRSMQLDFNDDVTNQTVQKVYDLVRLERDRPFFLCVSLTHPHNPYSTTGEFYDLYRHEDIDMPAVDDQDPATMDAHSRRLWYMFRCDEHKVTSEHIRTARHAYYAMISYVDAQVGRLLDALEAMDLSESTAIIFTSDHGDMLGERGLWYKWVHYESAVRILLLISLPGQTQGQSREQQVSLVDLFPMILDLCGASAPAAQAARVAGHTLAPLLAPQRAGAAQPAWDDVAFGEMNAEGALSPRRSSTTWSAILTNSTTWPAAPRPRRSRPNSSSWCSPPGTRRGCTRTSSAASSTGY